MSDETIERVAKAIRNVNETTVGLTYSELTTEMARAAVDEIQKIGQELMDAYGITERLPKHS